MKKIPCLFQRIFADPKRPTLTRFVSPGCEWVLEGHGKATRKRDGTACAVIDGTLFKRYDAKPGRAAPPGAIACGEPDAETGHWPHWVRVTEEPASMWHRAAWLAVGECRPDGTYELCGPHFSPAEGLERDVFFRHGAEVLEVPDRSWDGVRAFLEANVIEGIVFHHPDGRMAKIRRDDYGLPWKPGRQPRCQP